MSKKKYDIIWQEHARFDLYILIGYIAQNNPYRAVSFLKELHDKVDMLSYHPQLGKIANFEGVRALVVHKNYIVLYRLFRDSVQILRVKHAAQNWF